MLRSTINKMVRSLAMPIQKNHIRKLAISDTIPMGKVYNWPEFERCNEYRNAQYRDDFEADQTGLERLGGCCDER